MGDCCSGLRDVILEMRDLLKSIDQKMCHLLEQGRTERMFFRGRRNFRNEDE